MRDRNGLGLESLVSMAPMAAPGNASKNVT